MKTFLYRHAVLDLIYLQDQVRHLVKNHPKYQKISEILCAEDYFDDNLDISFPTMASISRETGLPYSRVKRYVKEIHDLIFDDNAQNLVFEKAKYRFIFSFGENHFDFTLNNLPVVPRVGENIHVPFFKANLNMDYFYVEEISYSFEKNYQLIEIWCKSGFCNQYLKFRKDKAEALGELKSDDIWKMDNSTLQRKLRNRDLDL